MRARRIALLLLLCSGAACSRGAELTGTVFVADFKGKALYVFEAPSWKQLGVVTLPGSPHSVDVEPGGGRVWTSNQVANSVSVIDVATRAIVTTVRVCKGPAQTAFSERRAIVACFDDGFAIAIDRDSLREVQRDAVGFGPHAIVPGPHNHLWTANVGSNDISEVDPATIGLLNRYPAGPEAFGLAFSPDGRYAFVTAKKWNAVSVISMSDSQILGSIKVGNGPEGIVASADGGRVYVSNRGGGTVSAINAKTFQVVGTIRVGTEPDGLALSADGRWLLVTNVGSGTLSVVDAGSLRVVRTVKAGTGPASVAIVA